MAVRYVRRVQLGAYMSRKGLNIVKTSSKKGSCHLFLHPQWSTITFGKMLFLPIFDPFLLPKRALFRVFWLWQQSHEAQPTHR